MPEIPFHLLPSPVNFHTDGSSSPWPEAIDVAPLPHGWQNEMRPLERWLRECSSAGDRPWKASPRSDQALVRFIEAPHISSSEGYHLTSSASGIEIRAAAAAGAWHALHTLRQIIRQSPDRPCFQIEDAPSLAVRGYLLDLSRDKVPTMDRLLALVGELAELKFNQLQLYTEHTFAFPGHELVWGTASPLTAEEIQALDQHCLAHGIELVPCMNTFGHWERWLRHPPYFRYAECPYGWRRPDGHGMPWGSTLHPGKESLALLEELFAGYLPLFSSPKVNIGGDEPWELGMGRSRQRCDRDGRAVVYREYLSEVISAAQRHKPEVQFWGDILLEDASAWDQAPAGATALVWGYEAGHPFAAQGKTLAERNIPCIICPGTSTWNSLGTRLGNALINIREATEQARSLGTAGVLLTDWGDHGHHQPDILSVPARAAFAEAAWSSATFDPGRITAALQHVVFPQETPAVLEVLSGLGRLHAQFRFQPPNRLPFAQVLTTPQDRLEAVLEQFTEAEVRAAEGALHSLRATLDKASGRGSSHAIQSLDLTIDLLLHCASRSKAHFQHQVAHRPALVGEMTQLIGRFEAHWLETNRPGGLHESSQRLRSTLESYPNSPHRRPPWPPLID